MRGKGVEVAAVGDEAAALLQAIDFEGKPCEVPIKSLECELASEITGTCRVDREKRTESVPDQLPAHHQGQTPAAHQSGGPTQQRESILSVAVKQPVERGTLRWGEETTGSSQFLTAVGTWCSIKGRGLTFDRHRAVEQCFPFSSRRYAGFSPSWSDGPVGPKNIHTPSRPP